MKKWTVNSGGGQPTHVLPIDDALDHIESPNCACQPRNDDGIWIHNAADGREITERAQVLLLTQTN